MRSGEQNAVFCSHRIRRVNRVRWIIGSPCAIGERMTQTLFDRTGNRKYLVARERLAFVRAACVKGGDVGAFCLTLAITGARISEVLALTPARIDGANGAIIFKTLKQRKKLMFRAVPVPSWLVRLLRERQAQRDGTPRLWMWGRTTAWKAVKRVMKDAGISEALCQPKALRHAFAVEATQQSVPLNVVQRWLGHARLETTVIYANVVGAEERRLAARMWKALPDHD